MFILLAPVPPLPAEPTPSVAPATSAERTWQAVTLTDTGVGSRRTVPQERLGEFMEQMEQHTSYPIRWVWADARALLPTLLAQGFSPERGYDLRVAQRILITATTHPNHPLDYAPTLDLLQEPTAPAGAMPPATVAPGQDSLFDTELFTPVSATRPEPTVDDVLTEFRAQQDAVARASHPAKLQLLLTAESSGTIIAEEMKLYGMPWNRERHEELLEAELGPRPTGYNRPARMEELAVQIREVLQAPRLNPDSPTELLKALQSAGARVSTTRKWSLLEWAKEIPSLQEQRHRLVDPILRYKKLSRLWSANGWNWLDEWVHDNRFYPSYEVGGVVTGRWGAHGGGAMQIPKDVRSAVAAEPGYLLTVADASQVEPRILAAMSGDGQLAEAGRGTDLYLGIAAIGAASGSALNDRAAAKIALLGAMYGATTGESGRLMPHLRQLFPRAIAFTEDAARVGEAGGQVSTFLGRVSPAPPDAWFAQQRQQSTAEQERAALSASRSWGRFTRNFVVQGTAAEWALSWMGHIRHELRHRGPGGEPLHSHLVYFLHDEIMIYGPANEAELCAEIVRDSAEKAGRLLFGNAPVEFPVSIAITDNYAKAK